jgi:hypothetical protein
MRPGQVPMTYVPVLEAPLRRGYPPVLLWAEWIFRCVETMNSTPLSRQ